MKHLDGRQPQLRLDAACGQPPVLFDLGPVAGVMIADYFIVRRCTLSVDDLYRRDGTYEYSGGINPKAIIALVLGVAIALIGLVVPSLRWLYDYAWFVGFFTAGGIYTLMVKSS